MSKQMNRIEVDGTQNVIDIQDFIKIGNSQEPDPRWEEERAPDRSPQMLGLTIIAALLAYGGFMFALGRWWR